MAGHETAKEEINSERRTRWPRKVLKAKMALVAAIGRAWCREKGGSAVLKELAEGGRRSYWVTGVQAWGSPIWQDVTQVAEFTLTFKAEMKSATWVTFWRKKNGQA